MYMIEVDDRIFKVSKNTIEKSEFLTSYIERWSSNQTITLDMSPRIFDHILSYLRDPNYKMPKECEVSLDYLLIPYTEDVFDTEISRLRNDVVTLKRDVLRLQNDVARLMKDHPEGWSECTIVRVFEKYTRKSWQIKVGDMVWTEDNYAEVLEVIKHDNVLVYFDPSVKIGFTDNIEVLDAEGRATKIRDVRAGRDTVKMTLREGFARHIINLRLKETNTVILNDKYRVQTY